MVKATNQYKMVNKIVSYDVSYDNMVNYDMV